MAGFRPGPARAAEAGLARFEAVVAGGRVAGRLAAVFFGSVVVRLLAAPAGGRVAGLEAGLAASFVPATDLALAATGTALRSAGGSAALAEAPRAWRSSVRDGAGRGAAGVSLGAAGVRPATREAGSPDADAACALLGAVAAAALVAAGAVAEADERGAGARRAGAGGGSSLGAGGRGTPRSTATGCEAVEPVVRRTGTGGAGGTGGPSPRPTTPSAVSRQVQATTSLMSGERSKRTIAVWLNTVSTRPSDPTG
jgi:hypothetical protein